MALSKEQQDNINTILRVGRSMGADQKMLLAAIETGFVESGMRNLKHGDRDSQGVFQQRPSQGWGTVAQVTNVEYAARKFFEAAARSKYRHKGTAGQLAQDVQRSAYPERYDQNEGRAQAALQSVGAPMKNVAHVAPKQGGKVAPGKNDRMLEGLFGLGVDINVLRSVDSNLPPDQFRRQLLDRGVKPIDFQRAEALVNLRPGSTVRTNVNQIMEVMGVTPEGMKRFNKLAAGNNDPNGIHAILRDILGPERAGNIMIKATGGKPPAGAVWNPYRGDAPPANADLRYGARGTTGPPAPATGPAGSVHYAQQRGGERGDAGPARAPTGPAGGVTPRGGAPGSGRPPGTATQLPGSGGYTDTTPALGAGASDAAVRAYVRKHYAQYAWMLDVPDIASVMRQAAEKGWEAEEITGAVAQTDWWKKTEPAARLWTEQTLIDPANTNDQINNQITVFRNQAKGLGITIPDADLRTLAEDSLKFAWTDNETRAALGRYYNYDPKNLLGAAAATSAALKQAAKDWMVPLDETTLGRWTEQVMRGEATTDFFDTYLADQARSLYPQLEDPISRNIKPTQWMAPYRTLAAETLEIDPQTIDLREEKWMRAINQVDDKGGRSPMTLYDWTNLLKTDEIYGFDKTQKGRDHGAALARNIAAQFGFATGGGL